MHATDPVTVTLLDGREAALRLTMAGLRRLLQRMQAKSIQQLWEQHGEIAVVGLMYEALPRDLRESMSEDEFAELLPASLEEIAAIAQQLLGVNSQRPFPAQAQAQ